MTSLAGTASDGSLVKSAPEPTYAKLCAVNSILTPAPSAIAPLVP